MIALHNASLYPNAKKCSVVLRTDACCRSGQYGLFTNKSQRPLGAELRQTVSVNAN